MKSNHTCIFRYVCTCAQNMVHLISIIPLSFSATSPTPVCMLSTEFIWGACLLGKWLLTISSNLLEKRGRTLIIVHHSWSTTVLSCNPFACTIQQCVLVAVFFIFSNTCLIAEFSGCLIFWVENVEYPAAKGKAISSFCARFDC